MATLKQHRNRKWAHAVLDANLDPINKVQKLVALGYEQEDAELMVWQHQEASHQMVYYEQLPQPEYGRKK
ncbi:hypothetical protein EPO04_01365 [Patescibacteria group bacterium]|nr:MAG: hypothetical protein EPO04_01365 [Patescibacteria group bacterium]